MIRKLIYSLGIIALMGALLTPRVEAGILITVNAGANTNTYYFNSVTTFGDQVASTGFFSLSGYNLQVQTTTTNYPGTAAIGTISTTVNIASVLNPAASMTTTIRLINDVIGIPDGLVALGNLPLVNGSPLRQWTAPTSSFVSVQADVGASVNTSISSGTAQTTTYFDSPGVNIIGAGTPVVQSGVINLASTAGNYINSLLLPNNGGTYTLSQSIFFTGINNGATSVNYTGNSSVVVSTVPVPAGIVLLGMGAPLLGAGYWMRRRRVAVA